MKVAIASDHGGYEYKQKLIPFIRDLGHDVFDLGTADETSVDYPDYAFSLGERVASGEFERGILICGTGIGMSISANKVKGIRCALCQETYSAVMSRGHNDANVLAVGGRTIGIEVAKEIVSVWLSTSFLGGRHQKRVDKINAYDNNR
ncbi:MAG: putative sugar phosphate isomerase YwlF [Firmicutes bacterium ADurb.Bin182]|nr:MAG: putative sugar phosphate isomerase YwlF [Firmicutes bacterium ADurb.Bin182]